MDSIKARGKDSKQNFWQEHIAGWKASGLSQQVYCSNNNLTVATFGYWRRKLKLQNGKVDKPLFYPLAVAPSQQTSHLHMDGKPLCLLLGGNRFVVEIENGFSTSTLQQLVGSIRQLWNCSADRSQQV